jgi:hypothetical protein
MPPRKAQLSARPLTATERLRAQIGLSPAAYARLGLKPDAWKTWNRRYGPWFRVEHGIGRPADLERIEQEPAPEGEFPSPPGL